ncbi:MAG TPA: multiheme c-type cytochrome [Burkholderiales bacterium]
MTLVRGKDGERSGGRFVWFAQIACVVAGVALAGAADAQRKPRGAAPSAAPSESAPAPAPAETVPAAAPAEATPAARGARGARGAAPAAAPATTQAAAPAATVAAADPHAKVFNEDAFPSATKCAGCHEDIYNEWRASNHAYAGISPMFHKFEQRISELAPTIGTFCVRCHMGVGTTLNEPRDLPLWKRSQVSREGVTCVSCHRVSTAYGKVNGERSIEPGSIHEPVYGPYGGDGVAEAVKNRGRYRVATGPGQRGTPMHTSAIKFEQISKSEFCVSCHQVAVNLGIKLEVVWDQYRASPAHKQGISCQDCHMGKVPGKAAGYATGPAAKMGRETVNPNRKRSNHAFYGPGYPIAHPGIFPHNKDVPEEWTVEKWLKFDYRAKWGSEAFEKAVSDGRRKVQFPPEWADPAERADAWRIVESNLQKIEEKRGQRKQVMENGSRVDGPFFDTPPKAGESLRFRYKVTNTDPGHNLPSGSLGAQPEIWLNVALTGPDGKRVWESGYVDSLGDMADLHSIDVRAGKVPHDGQLFNLQSKFLTSNVKGTDREMYLPVNFDVDQLPMLRPAPQPVSVLNHPPGIRMEQRSLPPLGSKMAKYRVPAEAIAKPGRYSLAVRLRSRAEPIYFMRFVNATVDMERAMNEWMLDFHAYTVEFEVKP